jgi:hypothetical protein
MFYNTNKTQDIATAIKQNNKQEMQVYKLFQQHQKLSPSAVWEMLGAKYPITSIRRAITDLTNQGLLVKTDNLTPGAYGKNEHVWVLSR